MDLSFGMRLRLQRERQDVTLRSIADQTKIKISLLEGLERDDLSQWPSGIYRRSYFRVYAQAIGLDPDAWVREFQECHPDPNEENGFSLTSPSPGNRPPMRLRYLIDSAVGALQPAVRQQTSPSEGHPAGVPAQPERIVSPAPGAPPQEPVAAGTGRPRSPVDFTALAQLCTRLAGAVESREIAYALEDLTIILNAVGVILWTWDPHMQVLVAVSSHGYSDELLRQLPRVSAENESAIAAAFRTGRALVVDGTDAATGAVVAPLLPPAGCAGVLAVELHAGSEQREDVRAATAIVAAQLATLVETPALSKAVNA